MCVLVFIVCNTQPVRASLSDKNCEAGKNRRRQCFSIFQTFAVCFLIFFSFPLVLTTLTTQRLRRNGRRRLRRPLLFAHFICFSLFYFISHNPRQPPMHTARILSLCALKFPFYMYDHSFFSCVSCFAFLPFFVLFCLFSWHKICILLNAVQEKK